MKKLQTIRPEINNSTIESNELPSYVKAVVNTYMWVKTHWKDTLLLISMLIIGHFFIKGAFGINLAERIISCCFPPSGPFSIVDAPNQKTGLPEDVKSLLGIYDAIFILKPGCRRGNKDCEQRDIIEIKKVTPIPDDSNTYSVEGVSLNGSGDKYEVHGFYNNGKMNLWYKTVIPEKPIANLLNTYEGNISLLRKKDINRWCGVWQGDQIDDEDKSTNVGHKIFLRKR